MHLLKKTKAGKKVAKKEAREEVEEEGSKEARKMIRGGKKTEPINAKKSNYEKHPEVKKKRGTSNGFMPR